MRIKTRIQLGIILSLVLAATIALLLFLGTRAVNEASRKVGIAAEVVKGVAELKIVTHEYMLYPEERSLIQLRSKYGSLSKLLTGGHFKNPDEKIVADQIFKNLERFKTVFSVLVTGLRKRQALGKQGDSAFRKLQDRLMGELLVKSQLAVSLAFQLQQKIEGRSVTTQKRNSLLTVLLLLILTAAIVGILLWVNRSVARPIAKLKKDTQIIGSGNLDHEVGITAKDEIGELSRAFDKMTQNLKETTTSIIELNKEIDERKQAEEALRRSENRMKAILTASPVGIGLFINRKLDWVNETFYNLAGYEQGSLIGQDARVFYSDDEEYERVGQELYFGADKSGIGEVKTKWVQQDGKIIDCHIRACHLDPKDPSKGRIVAIADISEAKQLAAQFQQAQKMEAVGRLAGGVAHDFNNLLMTIMGNADLMLMGLAEDDPFREKLEQIKGGGERAASLTRQLLAFSRKQILQPVVLDLNSLITGFVKMLERLIGEDVELETVLTPELRRVEADPGQMEQIIMNLVINARDAMPSGGKLTIETVNVDLDEGHAKEHDAGLQPGPYVMLGVSDTGMGMDDKTKSLIFEPFFTTKEVGKGTGLGLSTVYGIVKQSGGYIWVYSEPGQGTTFKIYLPAVEGEVVQVHKEQTASDDLTGSETILIVEDDDALRNLAREILELQGYKILDAENGIEALKVSEEHEGQIHLMITDVVMPKMGGRELEERLHPLRPEMKVVYMSGYTDETIVHHGVLKPGIEFLQKPLRLESLKRKVREVLNS